MTPTQQLFAIAVGLYLLECLIWPVANATLFVSYSLATWNIQRPRIQLFGGRRSVFLLAPFPPLGAHFVLSRFPFAISAQQLTSRECDVELQEERCWSPSELVDLSVSDRDFLAGKTRIARADSAVSAQLGLQSLIRWRDANDADRDSVVGREVDAMFDEAAARARIDEVQRVVKPTRIAANLLFVATFIAAPAVSYAFGFAATWPYWAAAIAVLWAQTLVLFIAARRKLYAGFAGIGGSEFTTMLLLPVAAIRTCDVLIGSALAHFHPLVLARILCSENDFRAEALQELRTLQFQSTTNNDDAAPEHALRDEFAYRIATRLTAYLAQVGVSMTDAVQPPLPDGADCVAYCPCCHAQFAEAAARCVRCGDLAVEPFATTA